MKELPEDINQELIKVLEPDEKPIDFRKEPWSYRWTRWIVLTNKRLYIIKRYPFGLAYDIEQVLLKGGHFELVEGMIFDTVYIRVSAEPEHIIQFLSKDRKNTVDFFEKIEATREGEPEEKVVAQAELEALTKIFYEKLITEEEYKKKKKEILDKM